jgi:hypothetical protein
MSNPRDKYETYEEANSAAIALSCTAKKDYDKKYKSDPKLPSSPQRSYPEFIDKGGWSTYLGTTDKLYKTWPAASKAAIALGFNCSREYFEGYKKDSKLPSDPSAYFLNFNRRGGWNGFLGKPVVVRYKTWNEASAATIKLGITSSMLYKDLYKKDPRLPSNPTQSYSDVWLRNGRWSGYFGKQLGSIDTSHMLNALKIIDMKGYTEIDHIKLPEDPLQTYDLQTFEELLMLKVYDLAQVKAYCERKEFQELKTYQNAARVQQHLPSPLPENIKGYISAKSIIRKLTDFERAKKEHPEYTQWFDMASKYSISGRNIKKKEKLVFYFVEQYLVGLEQPTEPAAFFVKEHEPPLLVSFMENQSKSNQSIVGINILHEFIDYTFQKCCQDEDDDGISVDLPGFANKWSRMISMVDAVDIDRPDKSEKWPLAMNYIDRAIKFLVPDSAKTFQDVKQMEPDWFIVDESIIDKDDPNCIWRTKKVKINKRKEYTRYEMWSPVRTFVLFVLFSMPLRGQQICWLDSGEADTEIPIINAQGEVVWVKNDHHLIDDVNKRTEKQGFLRRFKGARNTSVINDMGIKETRCEDIIGSYITTNKTGMTGKGYEVAYMPIHLIKWMIRLREWQSKYNPIDKLTPWVSVSILHKKNDKILKTMKSQAFLFRDPSNLHAGDRCQPVNRQTAIANYFPWVLYQIQDPDIPLAYLLEGQSATSMRSFRSDFTPHGMRISYISAYILDAKLPISVVASLVGHASIVMTIYYTVTTNQDYYEMLSAGHQDALAAAPSRIAGLLKNKQLKLSSSDFFDSNGKPVKPMYDKAPYAALAFKDFGICPVGCSKCHEGGDEVKPGSNIFGPVRAGYLGPSNCFVCRFFITGPGYIGGLKTVLAEVSLEAKESAQRMEKFREEKEELQYEQHLSRKDDLPFEHEAKLNNILTLYQQEQENFDALSCDATTIAIMGYRCSELLKNQTEYTENKRHQLILQEGNPMLGVKIDEVSEFAHMTEICQNAELYACANPSRALPKRTKMLDMFALHNGFSPEIFLLSDEYQLKVGNQMTSILLSHLKGSWGDVERLMDGTVTLKDLGLSGKEIMEPVTLALNHWTPKAQNRIEVINV